MRPITIPETATRLHAAMRAAPAEPTPTPTGTEFPFDWDKIRPNPGSFPKNGIFYDMAGMLLWLGAIAALSGLVAGAIAFGVGPIFGAHIISDRGKSMMWKAGLVAVIVGSATTITAWLLSR